MGDPALAVEERRVFYCTPHQDGALDLGSSGQADIESTLHL